MAFSAPTIVTPGLASRSSFADPLRVKRLGGESSLAALAVRQTVESLDSPIKSASDDYL
ncbi:MAG: hypothetical protein IID51_04675 [Proteobacteria bacterium]|nr:hypothetical protein [Pseudomonadota bacterium]